MEDSLTCRGGSPFFNISYEWEVIYSQSAKKLKIIPWEIKNKLPHFLISVKARIGQVCKSVFKPAFINCLYDMKFFIPVNVSLMSVFILKQNPA